MNLIEETNLWMVIHESEYGTSVSTVASKEMPTQEEVIKRLIDFDENANECIYIYQVELDNLTDMDKGIEIQSEYKIGVWEPSRCPIGASTRLSGDAADPGFLSYTEKKLVSYIEKYYPVENEYKGTDLFVEMGHDDESVFFLSLKDNNNKTYSIERRYLDDSLSNDDLLSSLKLETKEDE